MRSLCRSMATPAGSMAMPAGLMATPVGPMPTPAGPMSTPCELRPTPCRLRSTLYELREALYESRLTPCITMRAHSDHRETPACAGRTRSGLRFSPFTLMPGRCGAMAAPAVPRCLPSSGRETRCSPRSFPFTPGETRTRSGCEHFRRGLAPADLVLGQFVPRRRHRGGQCRRAACSCAQDLRFTSSIRR